MCPFFPPFFFPWGSFRSFFRSPLTGAPLMPALGPAFSRTTRILFVARRFPLPIATCTLWFGCVLFFLEPSLKDSRVAPRNDQPRPINLSFSHPFVNVVVPIQSQRFLFLGPSSTFPPIEIFGKAAYAQWKPSTHCRKPIPVRLHESNSNPLFPRSPCSRFFVRPPSFLCLVMDSTLRFKLLLLREVAFIRHFIFWCAVLFLSMRWTMIFHH